MTQPDSRASRFVDGDAAALEWRSTGSSADGSNVKYEGVSIVVWEGDRIRRFRAYFDSAALAASP